MQQNMKKDDLVYMEIREDLEREKKDLFNELSNSRELGEYIENLVEKVQIEVLVLLGKGMQQNEAYDIAYHNIKN